jgi:hypothetical protein
MALKDQPKESQGAPEVPSSNVTSNATGNTGSNAGSSAPTLDDVLKPFQEASTRLLQANLAAQETAFKQRAKAELDYQDEVRNVEQEAYRALTAATRKQLDQLGQQGSGSPEQQFSARAQAQLDYEDEVRRIYTDAQTKLTAAAQKACDANAGGDAVQQLTNQRQDAYKTYLSDVQQAWSSTKALDPQTVNVIATHIMSTMSAVSQ